MYTKRNPYYTFILTWRVNADANFGKWAVGLSHFQRFIVSGNHGGTLVWNIKQHPLIKYASETNFAKAIDRFKKK